jgi:hypothetical protein
MLKCVAARTQIGPGTRLLRYSGTQPCRATVRIASVLELDQGLRVRGMRGLMNARAVAFTVWLVVTVGGSNRSRPYRNGHNRCRAENRMGFRT